MRQKIRLNRWAAVFAYGFAVAGLTFFYNIEAGAAPRQKPIVVYLLEDGNTSVEPVELPEDPPEILDLPPQTDPDVIKNRAQKRLDEIILEKANVRQKRILKGVLKDQQDFMKSMDEFVKTEFDANDDRAKPAFNDIRAKIVKLVFDAPDQRFYYERLYLINVYWLNHQDQLPRFESLDRHLRDRWLELEEKRRQIRSLITNGAAIVGAVGLGYFSYTRAMKIFPVVQNGSTWATLGKWAGRVPIILVGAGVGMVLGQYIGFLGSDLILKNQRDFIDPVDGNEDLQDLLDVIEGL